MVDGKQVLKRCIQSNGFVKMILILLCRIHAFQNVMDGTKKKRKSWFLYYLFKKVCINAVSVQVYK